MKRRILVNGSNYQAAYIGSLTRLLTLLLDSGRAEIGVTPSFLAYLEQTMPATFRRLSAAPEDFAPDLMLSIGGDGTFLSTAALAGSREIPVMGINSGHLGYLAAAKISEVELLTEAILEGKYAVSPRSLIEVTPEGREPLYALNEAAFIKQDTASMIHVATRVSVAPTPTAPGYSVDLADYLGDGLIVATPTGSTGYNLSVGGPIVAPSARNFILSPVAAHSLTMRPLVVPDTSQFDIVTRSRTGQFLLSVDGRPVVCASGTRCHLRRAPFVVNLVHLPDHNFIDTLRTKLLWGLDGR